jgi:F-type H+-transporting ATPase subunit gamma
MSGGALLHLRNRVHSVKNIQQITRAMKFVSASRLRRSQDRIFSARPYAKRMLEVLNSLATRVESDQHPLLLERENHQVMLIVITADKGLCGAFNSNIIKAAVKEIESDETNKEISMTLVGRKAADWFRKRPWPIKHQYLNIMSQVEFKYAQEIAHNIIDYYTKNELDAVFLVYNEFKSVIRQEIIIEPLLPIGRLKVEEARIPLDYIYEQSPSVIFDRLLTRHIETQVFRAMLESEASEHGARMTAMDSATRNATEVIENLTRYMNRIRQAGITTEIIEVVSGADALQGD